MRLRQYFLRAILLRCPSCGQPTLVRRLLAVHDECRDCGLFFNHDDGFWQGAWHFNYFIASLLAIIPACVFAALGAWSISTALIYAAAVSVLFPIAFYWHSHSLWIATYYYFVPDDLRMGRDLPHRRRNAADDALLSADERERLWAEEGALDLEGDRFSRS